MIIIIFYHLYTFIYIFIHSYIHRARASKKDSSKLHHHGLRKLIVIILPRGPLYGMSRDELLCLRKEITELLDRNWIRASSSPGGVPVLFVKKPGGAISKARWFTKIDVSAAFHRIRVKQSDEWKTAFQTRLGKFERLVMHFGLTGAPAAWQRWINDLLREHLDHLDTPYFDDILIWSDGTRDDHLKR